MLEDESQGPRRFHSTGSLVSGGSHGTARPTNEVSEEEWNRVMTELNLKDEVNVPCDRGFCDVFMGALIVANAIVVGLETDLGEDISPEVWLIIENVFCIICLIEIAVKLCLARTKFFRKCWNILDLVCIVPSIVNAWIVPAVVLVSSGSVIGEKNGSVKSVGLLRLARVLRMLRLLRLLRIMTLFNELWLMVNGFVESLRTLWWVLLLMLIVTYCFAILLRITIDCEVGGFQQWDQCAPTFGSISRSMYTLFQVITLDSWSSGIGRNVFSVEPALFPVFLRFLFITTFGLLNVVVGVIVENTLNAAKQNEILRQRRTKIQMLRDSLVLKTIFEQADIDCNGYLDRHEFQDILRRSDVRRDLAEIEVPMDDPDMIFDMLDEEELGRLDVAAFVLGIQRVRGAPTSLDTKAMFVVVKAINRRLLHMEQVLTPQPQREFNLNEVGDQGFTCQVSPFSCESNLERTIMRRVRRPSFTSTSPVSARKMPQGSATHEVELETVACNGQSSTMVSNNFESLIRDLQAEHTREVHRLKERATKLEAQNKKLQEFARPNPRGSEPSDQPLERNPPSGRLQKYMQPVVGEPPRHPVGQHNNSPTAPRNGHAVGTTTSVVPPAHAKKEPAIVVTDRHVAVVAHTPVGTRVIL